MADALGVGMFYFADVIDNLFLRGIDVEGGWQGFESQSLGEFCFFCYGYVEELLQFLRNYKAYW